ncbi:MAG TPA: reverse transcriptase domain-containing protein, partial [Fusibacter sp.]|nr:reverse transcriptase domain-containing protein [Fusibacter sp.]
VKKLIDRQNECNKNLKTKYLVSCGDKDFDEILTYNDIVHLLNDQLDTDPESQDSKFTYDRILDHEGPLKKGNPNYKGSLYNVLLEWDSGEETWEPLDLIIQDDPLSITKYAEENNLLDKQGWKRLKRYANNKGRISRMIQQLKNKRSGPKFSFGIQVPRNVKEAMMLDNKNGNTLWQDAIEEELNSLNAYDTFEDKGKISYLQGHKNIIVHFVFAVKHDLRHKARLVAGGHLTDPTTEGTYSGVVQLRSLRIALLAAELNNLDIMVGDISSAYLEAKTKEQVCFIAGPEFKDKAGNLMKINKALYGLRTSGARWHDKFANTLKSMGYFVCKADPDVWIKDCDTHYEYVCVYVDDIMHIGKNPQKFFDALTNEHNYKLKGVGKPVYHLGGDFSRDEKDNTLAWGTKSYVKKMLNNYKTMFGNDPKPYSTPMAEQDHPELDLTEELDETGIKMYQSLIGALQWLVTLGRFDILCAVATMGSYRVAPRKGHLEHLQRIYGYIRKFPDGAIRFRTNIPTHEDYAEIVEHNWESIYEDAHEELPPDMPPPKGKYIRTTTYVDANLMHCLVTGRSMTGIIHIINQTPIQWFSKRQNNVETATYGSEFMAARQATEQIMDIRYTLLMMGIPIDGPSWLFGDNQSVITSSNIPESTLNKRHNALSYHRVRECIASKIMYFIHIASKYNPSDFLTKALGFVKFRPLVQPLLFWKGDTLDGKYDLPLP